MKRRRFAIEDLEIDVSALSTHIVIDHKWNTKYNLGFFVNAVGWTIGEKVSSRLFWSLSNLTEEAATPPNKNYFYKKKN